MIANHAKLQNMHTLRTPPIILVGRVVICMYTANNASTEPVRIVALLVNIRQVCP